MNQSFKPVEGGRSLIRAVFQAILILAVAVGFSQAVLFPLIQSSLIGSVQRWEVEYLNSGTIDLLAAELSAVPAGKRADILEELSPKFGFNLALQHLREVDLNSAGVSRLQNGELVGDESNYSAYKLLDGGEDVLAFIETKRPATHMTTEAQRRSMGAIAMLERTLRRRPRSEWPGAIDSAAKDFGYPIGLAAVSDLNLTIAQRESLEAGRIVTIATEDSVTADYPAEMVYKMVGDSVIALGPFSPPILKRYYPVIAGYYVLLGLVVILPLGLWLAPTWLSMNQLSTATAAFGHGDFSVRAAPIRGSKTNHLIEVFNQMAGKIQGLVESNKALINAVSHELRTPISRIEFNIELARQSNDIAERNRQLDRIEDSVDELKTMVSEMLQYARFDREKPNFSMESVDIGAWLDSELKNWRNDDSKTDIRIGVPDMPVRVSLERYYMSRAISNLVRNAVRFAKSTIQIDARLMDGFAEISVSDDGPGVDYQERTKIFEPFVRHGHSRNRESGGTGLGLAIVKQILAWHSGKVWVEDSDMGGAKFVVRWPHKEEPVANE